MLNAIDPRGIDPVTALAIVSCARQQVKEDGPLYDEEADRIIARAVSLAMAGVPQHIGTDAQATACLVGAALAVYLIKNGDVDL